MEERDWEKGNWVILGKKREEIDLIKNTRGGFFNQRAATNPL